MSKTDGRKLVRQRIRDFPDRRLSAGLLGTYFHTTDDRAIYEGIAPLLREGLIAPAQGARLRGGELYTHYVAARPGGATDLSLSTGARASRNEFVASLNGRLTANGFLASHPDECLAWHDELLRLSAWLDAGGPGETVRTTYERSWEIFCDDKALERGGWHRKARPNTLLSVIRGCNIGAADLGVRDAPPTFETYVAPRSWRRRRLVLAVSENRDPWYAVRARLVAEGRTRIFGVAVDGVVYGMGQGIASPHALERLRSDLAFGGAVDFLYWGDVDRRGVAIFNELLRQSPACAVRPLTGAYRAMLREARGRSLPMGEPDGLDDADLTLLAAGLSRRERDECEQVLRDNLRIPQECVRVEDHVGGGLAPGLRGR